MTLEISKRIFEELEESYPDFNSIAECLSGDQVNVNYVNPFGRSKTSTFHKACWIGNKDLVIMLLNKGAKLDSKDVNGDTPLHYASYRGHTEIVLLLNEYANYHNYDNFVDHRNNSGKTALHLAFSKGYINIISILLQIGANLNLQDYYGKTPVEENNLSKDDISTVYLIDKLLKVR